MSNATDVNAEGIALLGGITQEPALIVHTSTRYGNPRTSYDYESGSQACLGMTCLLHLVGSNIPLRKRLLQSGFGSFHCVSNRL